ncbi:MAG: phosphatase PAP2 family protein [Candidatus Auribacterota bacterium]|nr:phosphatase PAP2 family protein [Candidatus Auribacterota bacterium]
MNISRYNRISERLILAYLAFLAVFILIFQSFITSWFYLLLTQIIAGAILIGLVKLQAAHPDQPLLRTIRNWLPLPYVIFGYKMIHYLITSDRNPGFMMIKDRWLIIADRYLFGCDPTVWLQRVTTPWLSEVLQLLYATNYFLPLILALTLYLKKEKIPFQKTIFVVTLGYILSYLGYFVIPAIGPRFTIHHTVPLQGLFIREQLHRIIYSMESCPRDCFPSGHTEIPLITLWLAYRFKRVLFWIYLPIVTGLVCSTVYLRYHYVVDVIAGMALAGIVILLARRVENREWGMGSGDQETR